jgi:hypothetical protein
VARTLRGATPEVHRQVRPTLDASVCASDSPAAPCQQQHQQLYSYKLLCLTALQLCASGCPVLRCWLFILFSCRELFPQLVRVIRELAAFVNCRPQVQNPFCLQPEV